jgi:hypothetical protein
MPWTSLGGFNCAPGENVTIMTGLTVNQRFVFEQPTQLSTTRVYWGVLEFCRTQSITGLTLVVTISSWTFWGPLRQIDVGNSEPGGFIRFRLRSRFKQPQVFAAYRFTP